MKKVLLLGYFGAANFGDDALLTDWLVQHADILRNHGITADVVAHSDKLLGSFREGQQLADLVGEPIERRSLLSCDISGYSALIAPGGSLLQDSSSVRSLLYYLYLIRRFTSAGKPVFMLNQGIGPLSSWLASFLTPRALSRVAMLSLRDKPSYEWASGQRQLSGHDELHIAADPILAGRLEAAASAPANLGLPEEYILCMPRPTGDLPTALDPIPEPEALADLLSRFTELAGLPVALLALQPGRDQQFCTDTAGCVESNTFVINAANADMPPGTAALGVVRGASLVASYRLHGLVAAASYGIPAMGVAYDPKISALCDVLGYPYCFPATVHEQSTLADARRLWESRGEVSEHAGAKRTEMLARLSTSEQRFTALWKKTL